MLSHDDRCHNTVTSLTSLPLALTMPRAIIAPSVLASDFGQLTAECKRMIKGGAEWLHMGTISALLLVEQAQFTDNG